MATDKKPLFISFDGGQAGTLESWHEVPGTNKITIVFAPLTFKGMYKKYTISNIPRDAFKIYDCPDYGIMDTPERIGVLTMGTNGQSRLGDQVKGFQNEKLKDLQEALKSIRVEAKIAKSESQAILEGQKSKDKLMQDLKPKERAYDPHRRWPGRPVGDV